MNVPPSEAATGLKLNNEGVVKVMKEGSTYPEFVLVNVVESPSGSLYVGIE